VTIKARLSIAVVLLLTAITALLGFIVIRTTRDAMIDQINDRLLSSQEPPGRPSGPGLGPDDADDDDVRPYRETAVITLDPDGEIYEPAT
jgi:hypothetical protein